MMLRMFWLGMGIGNSKITLSRSKLRVLKHVFAYAAFPGLIRTRASWIASSA